MPSIARRQFAEWDREFRRDAARAVARGSGLLAGEVRRRAPVVTGAMRASVRVAVARAKKRISSTAWMPLSGGHGDRDTNTVLHVEYGTADAEPRPFWRPAVADSAPKIEAIVRRGVAR